MEKVFTIPKLSISMHPDKFNDELKKYRCSVCKKELTQEEVNNFRKQHEGLDFNWGQCNGEDSTIEEII